MKKCQLDDFHCLTGRIVDDKETIMAGDGLSTGTIIVIAVGSGCVLTALIISTCIIRSRSQRKQRRFRHTFRGTFKSETGAILTSLNRFSKKPGKHTWDTVYYTPENPTELRYVVQPQPPAQPVQIKISAAGPSLSSIPTRDNKTWLFPDEKLLGMPTQQDPARGKQSPVLFRHDRPPKPLPRNIYNNVPATGTRLYRSNSDCSSVVAYDLGNPRNSHAITRHTRHSSIYFSPHSQRQRTDTGGTARSSGMAMDLGKGMHQEWMMLDNDYFRKHSITHL